MILSFRLYRWLCGVMIALVFLLLAGPGTYAQTEGYDDKKLKSVFIYNLTHFASWPEAATIQPSSCFCICLLGDDLFNDDMDKAVESESIHGAPIIVRRSKELAGIGLDTCQILFIDAAYIDNLPEFLAETRGKPILTMADTPGFAEKGGMVNLLQEKRRIHIEVNTAAVKAAGLKLNAKLLQLARIVDGPIPAGDQ